MQMPEQLVFVVGPAGSGKDTLGDHAERTHSDRKHLSLSTKLRQLHAAATTRQLDTPQNLGAFGTSLRQQYGGAVLVDACLDDWRLLARDNSQRPRNRLILSGHATPEEVNAVRAMGGSIVALTKVTPAIGYERRHAQDVGTAKEMDETAFGRRVIRENYGIGGPYTPFDHQAVMYPFDRRLDASRPLDEVLPDFEAILGELDAVPLAQRLAEYKAQRIIPLRWQDEEAEMFMRLMAREDGLTQLAQLG